jgi:hypothetical protein
MESHIATEAPRVRVRRTARQFGVLSLGPLTVAAGIAWALLQPYRVTLFDPSGQGFWWLFVQPPLLVILVGVLFHFVVVPPLLRDLEEHGAGR